MGSCIDLTDQMNNPKVADAFSFLVSGKLGYKAVIERKEEPVKCSGCAVILKGVEKFCPECGERIAKASTPALKN
ncbi:MAG: YgiT-type zinc finger protein [Nanoarchaeota archaeon]